MTSKTEVELLREISHKLDKLIGVVAIGAKPVDEQLSILRELGHSWDEIGPLVGMKPDAARIRHSRKAK